MSCFNSCFHLPISQRRPWPWQCQWLEPALIMRRDRVVAAAKQHSTTSRACCHCTGGCIRISRRCEQACCKYNQHKHKQTIYANFNYERRQSRVFTKATTSRNINIQCKISLCHAKNQYSKCKRSPLELSWNWILPCCLFLWQVRISAESRRWILDR